MASFSSSDSQSGLPGISDIAEQLMQAQYAWGQQQFAQNSQLTDQVVGDMMNLYGSLSGMGTTLMNQYSQYFMPEYQNLVNDANNYASQARIQQAMGAAESGVAQNFNGQRNAALADLQGFGIDPSSGRYAQLDQAERTQEAAAAAGAGFQAEQATEATGRALRSEALQLGSVMPSQATAAYNAAGQAATAAENATLANSQEGVNMMGSPTQWGALGQQLRTSASTGGGGGGGGGQRPPDSISGSNQGHPTPAFGPGESSSQADPNWAGTGGGNLGGGGGGGGGYQQSGPAIRTVGGGGGGGGGDNGPIDMGPGSPYDPTGVDDWNSQGGINQGPGVPIDTSSSLGSLPPGDNSAGTGEDTSGFNQDTGPTPAPAPTSDQSSGSYTPGGSQDQTQSGDYGPSPSDNSSSSGGYARGGIIDKPHNGMGGGRRAGMGGHSGAIPYSRSPSYGKDTDDVHGVLNQTGEPLRLNAGEFVMPRHTVAWKGEEYFQRLIEKSKKARAGAGAKPTMKPALRQGAIPMGARHG